MKKICTLALISGLSFPLLAANKENNDPCCGVKISGYLDTSYNYLVAANQFQGGIFDRSFDIKEDGFTLQQIAATVAYQPDDGIGGLINPIFGRDAITTAPYGYNAQTGDGPIGFDLLQVYAQYGLSPLTVMAGRFITLTGAEVVDTTANTNFSRSLLYTLATPITHTGVRTIYTITDSLKFILGVNNGWDNIRDTSRDKTLEFGIAFNPGKIFSFSAQGYTGEERVVARTATGPVGTRTLIDLVAAYQMSDSMSLVLNYDYGVQNNVTIEGSSIVGKAVWQGIAAYFNYKLNENWRVSLRGEDFSDRNGYRTGTHQTLKEMTFTLGYAPWKNIEFRGETRRDISNANAFMHRGSDTPKKVQQSFALECVYKFSNSN
ncbi:MAG: hypothetical protein BGO43_00680 [Gammaproteobacteria bacterium 39-13]|nr:porin [Gammaproteobacteria bacterium]OJV96771.1 MAG: hypothetical protein BGO43_00680 [Gammaproteobacteria bacterium 39-13]